MALKASLLLAFFLLFSTSFARQQQHQQQQWWQQNQCQLRNIEALEPYDVIQAEAGLTEFWDANNQQFQCAGVDFVRHRIQPGGLLLPSYVNTPILSFVERGHAVHGVILPGCPETYQYSPEQTSGQSRQDISDRHQRVESLNQGDLVAVPTGAAHWIHNDGNEELVVVVFFDTQNQDNQLDQYRRRFFLAGNPQARSQQQQPRGQRGQQQDHQSRGQREDQPHRNADNIFKGFDIRYLAEVFNVDEQTAEKLQGQNDQRGHIVNAGQNLQLVRPQGGRHQRSDRRGGWSSNGIEETVCSLKLSINIDNPSHADFVNPQAGQIANLNTFKFPILGLIKLSAERGQLHQNAIQSPHWTLNAHNLLYVTHGSMRIQIVNNEGNSVFDNELQQGQVVVIPQNFGVIKRAGEQGCRWVSFKTNDNAMISNLAGRVSAMTSMPVDVVANAYQIPREDAQRLKFGQRETVLISPSFSRGQKIRLPSN